jgi:hypothetical protein
MKFSNLGKGIFQALCDKDKSQFAMDNVWYDAKRGRLVATNGHTLAVAHVQVDAGDVTGFIQPLVLSHYRRLLLKYHHADNCVSFAATETQCIITDHLDGIESRFRRPLGRSGFPNYEAALPKVEGDPAICLSLSKLIAVVKAIGSPETSSRDDMVAIWTNPEDPTKPVLVKTSQCGALGVIAPMMAPGEAGGWLTTVAAVEAKLYEKNKGVRRNKAQVATMPPPKTPEASDASMGAA